MGLDLSDIMYFISNKFKSQDPHLMEVFFMCFSSFFCFDHHGQVVRVFRHLDRAIRWCDKHPYNVKLDSGSYVTLYYFIKPGYNLLESEELEPFDSILFEPFDLKSDSFLCLGRHLLGWQFCYIGGSHNG